jgi:DNA-binding LacI/PurR family transcriptional regulator
MIGLEKNSAQPFYEQLKILLRRRIANGEFKADSAIPDERSLAAQMGISRMTARRAIVELSDEGLLRRVRGRGTFVRGSFAPPLKKTRRAAIGIVASFDRIDFRDGIFYHRILQGLYRASEEEGQLVAFRKITEPYSAFVAALRADTSLRSLIVLGISDPVPQQMLSKLSMPVVLLDSCQPSTPMFDEVSQNAEPAVFEAISALIELGHRRIGLLISEGTSTFILDRRRGYERALSAAGIDVREDLIYPVLCTPEESYARMRALLASGNVPTAMFCTSDGMAMGATAAVTDHGWRVPHDMSIIGYGDNGMFTSPSLSTIRVPMEHMGQESIRVLMQRRVDPTAPLRRVLIPTEWISRQSCAEPRRNK